MVTTPITLVLTPEEKARIGQLVQEIENSDINLAPCPFASSARIYSDELPRRVRESFHRLRYSEAAPAIIVSNNPDFDDLDSPTPSEIPQNLNDTNLTADEILHIMYGSLLGDIFTWDTIQNRNLINYVIPIKENEEKPISSGSKNIFDLHTEDAFHKNAEEFFGLFCIRNVERAATLISYVGDLSLDQKTVNTLASPSYLISPNMAHDVKQSENRQAVLFGDLKSPYIRANFNVGDSLSAESDEYIALENLYRQLSSVSQHLILGRGDALYVDNYRTLHGRVPYTPVYGPKGRWLKRLYITASFRQSRAERLNAESRIINASGRQ